MASQALDAIAGCRSRGPESTGSSSRAHALKEALSDGSDGLPGDAWTLRERRIFIGCAIGKIPRDLHWTHREHTIVEIFIG